MRRVVVTGIGTVSGNGTGAKEVWRALSNGEAHRSRIADVHFNPEENPTPYKSGGDLIVTVCGSTLSNEELAELSGVAKPMRFDRHQLFALLAAKEALLQSGALGHYEDHRFGITGGTGDGGLYEDAVAHTRIAAGKQLDPFTNIRELPNIFAGQIANTFGLKGPGFVHCTACAASAHALQSAADVILLERAEAMLVVGTEAAITPFGLGSFAAQRALSNFSRPYQKDRKGFLMGEGAAALVLEDRERAIRRGATILAEIAGYGATTDGVIDGLITDPDSDGGKRSALAAMMMAGIEPNDIAYIKTHGTGTPAGDKAELEGIKMWAAELATTILLSSTKSFSGHLLGAAGAYEAVLCIFMLLHKLVLPTFGLTEENLDPDLPRVAHVMGSPRELQGDFILANAFGFGGTNATIIFRGHA